MTYEKDIPDFAMVPAREIEEKVIVPVGGSAVYTPDRKSTRLNSSH